MAYKQFTPARKFRRSKRRPRRRTRLPFNKRQARVIKSLALKSFRKGQEIKRCFKKVNEFPIAPQLSSAVINDILDMDTGDTGDNFTQLSIAGNQKQRWGNEVQPLSLNIRGLIKINGSTTTQDTRETMVRLVLVERNQNTPAIPTSDQLFMIGNDTEAPAGDINDIFAPFNWKYVRPVYDRTFKLCPASTQQLVSGTGTTTFVNGSKDYATFNIRHYFGKNAKPMKWSVDANTVNAYANDRNYQLFVYARNMNDDNVLTTNTVEISCTSIFSYYDS